LTGCAAADPVGRSDRTPPGWVVPPLMLDHWRFDHHFLIYFAVHAEFKAAEFMIHRRENGSAVRLAALIDHRNRRHTYISGDEPGWKAPPGWEDAASARIDFTESDAGEPVFRWRLTAYDGFDVRAAFVPAGPPRERHGGLVEPGPSSAGRGHPLIWRRQSALAAPGSKISINGQRLTIPVQVHVPPAFTGLEAFWTQGLDVGVIRTGRWELNHIDRPAALQTGRSWQYRLDGRRWTVRIERVDGAAVTASAGRNQRLGLVFRSDPTGPRVESTFAGRADPPAFQVAFRPPAPMNPSAGDRSAGVFSVLFGGRTALSGTVQVQTGPGRVRWTLTSESPEWAAGIKWTTRVRYESGQVVVETHAAD
jgi:hypothetical protein